MRSADPKADKHVPQANVQDLEPAAAESRPRERLRDLVLTLLVVALCAVLAGLQPANAAQTLDIRDGDTAIVRISIRDQTRLRADRARVLDVIGDVFDASKNPTGRLIVLKDPDGEFYLKPMPGQVLPVKLDVKTDRGTVGLLLQPAETIGETLTLRVSGSPAKATANDAATTGKSSAYVRSIKALMLAMASPEMAGELPGQALPGGGEVVSLWQEARFVLKARYEAGGLIGESYELTNVSGQPMVVDEREFFKPGVGAVSVMRLNLAPGQSTAVWIVRQGTAEE